MIVSSKPQREDNMEEISIEKGDSPGAVDEESQRVILGDGLQKQREADDVGEPRAPVHEPGGGQPVVVEVEAHPVAAEEAAAHRVCDRLDQLTTRL